MTARARLVEERQGTVKATATIRAVAMVDVPDLGTVFVPQRVVEAGRWPLVVGDEVRFLINLATPGRPGMRPQALRAWRRR